MFVFTESLAGEHEPRGRAASPTVLVLPGFRGSGPDHWQSRWEARLRGLKRVEQSSWDAPRLGDWATRLEEAVRAHDRVLLVAHSLACVLVAHWARWGSTTRVAGALLVAPADVERPGAPRALASFGPVPLLPLPFPTRVVASSNDPHATLARACEFASAWRAELVEVGACGHLNVDSGHGDWPEGERLLDGLRVSAARRGRVR